MKKEILQKRYIENCKRNNKSFFCNLKLVTITWKTLFDYCNYVYSVSLATLQERPVRRAITYIGKVI